MNYKGYSAEIVYDPDDRVLHGRIQNISHIVSFEARCVDDLERELQVAVDDYLAFCAEQGIEAEKPYSGRILLRTTPAQHQQVAVAARRAGSSINTWICDAIDAALRLAPAAAGAGISANGTHAAASRSASPGVAAER